MACALAHVWKSHRLEWQGRLALPRLTPPSRIVALADLLFGVRSCEPKVSLLVGRYFSKNDMPRLY